MSTKRPRPVARGQVERRAQRRGIFVVAGVARDNAGAAASGRLGSVGMVVGATVGSAVTDLGLDLAGAAGPLLAPGLGAPGGAPAALRGAWCRAAQVLGTSSREVLVAGPDVGSLRDAARRAADDLAAALTG